ncbi:MarR family transcriptional regulator [Evansella sp. AB-P1]|uniref:MarR family winged helix-turn-helix transcriptional regulator n=1 Tax=Evansella sp. AB-P1 TaxID=3037653 RepID=UPI0024201B4E|nr:MarR family transcriptional regulator [Evansella sp. AB-P1]MDG5788962.1 MarR family transcriptional regulator [Evansella sp. AB-P1]
MNKEEIINELEDVILDINLFIRQQLGSEISSALEAKIASLSSNQLMTLFLVAKKELNHVKDIASYLNISTSAVSQIVGKLENQGFLHREINQANRRSTIITLGCKGTELINEMDQIKSTIFQQYLSKMEVEDLLLLKNSFKKFLTVLVESKEDHD